MTRAELEAAAAAIMELKRRNEEEAIRFYSPCCGAHGINDKGQAACPVRPCPDSKHTKFHSSTKLIRIIFGGNRSGKSMAGLAELLFRACFKAHPFTKEPLPKKGKYRIFCPKLDIAAGFIVPLLQIYVPKKLLINGKWEGSYNSRYNILTLKSGTIIDIKSYDQDTTGAASVELDGVWADEEMPERLFSETLTRLISRKGKIWLTVTPLYNMTWAMRYWEKVDDPNVEVFRLSIHDNPYLPPAERDAIIANWPPNERRARELGEFLEFEGIVYKELDSKVHVIPSQQPQGFWPVICAVDPHPRKATVVTWSFVTPHDDVVFFDEMEVKGTAREIVAAIRQKEAGHKARTALRLIDPAANKQVSGIGNSLTTLREFENAGMSFTLADNSEGGYNAVHEYLSFDNTKPVDSLNRPRCYFTADVPKTWYGMTHLLWEEWRVGKDLKDAKERVKDKEKDFPDVVRYTLAQRPSVSASSEEPVDLPFQII
jgi:phage terminase large subunit-like protein